VILHTVFISYHRRHLTEAAIDSYLRTVSVPYTLMVVDNGSGPDVERWLEQHPYVDALLLGENKYPGYACNRGFELAPPSATVLHRADNDFVFLPGWCDTLQEAFDADPLMGQVGLRTDGEELHNTNNTGGNCAFRRQLWDEGLRWDERPWPKIKTVGWTEDSYMSPAVIRAGWKWGRVPRPCIRPISVETDDDEYYRQTWADRGIEGTAR
jgi:hypothetical protein